MLLTIKLSKTPTEKNMQKKKLQTFSLFYDRV